MKNLEKALSLKKNYFSFFFLIIIVFIFAKTLINYNGEKIYYIFFTLVFNFSIYKILFQRVLLFELFFGFLIWLGFWFKFSIFESNIYRSTQIFDGRVLCNFDQNNFDEVLFISSIGCLGFIVAVYIFNKIKKLHVRNILSIFEIKNKNIPYILLGFFFIFYFIIIISNLKIGLYQKGLLENDDFYFLSKILFPYLYNVGFGAAISFLVYNLHNSNPKNFFLIFSIILVEGFFTNFSMLSRNMILYSSSIFLGYFLLIYRNNQLKIFKYKLIISYLFLSVIFFVSLLATNLQRDSRYINNEEIISTKNEFVCLYENKSNNLNKMKFLELFITRSIGIEGIIVTQMNKEILGLDLLKLSFDEKFDSEKSFYEKKFLKFQDRERYYKNSNQVILPGIFGYVHFSGSKIFLFIALSLITFICLCFEKTLIFFTKNPVFTSFIIFCLVWRLINFGYLVSNTFNFILSLIFTSLIIVVIQKCINKNVIQK